MIERCECYQSTLEIGKFFLRTVLFLCILQKSDWNVIGRFRVCLFTAVFAVERQFGTIETALFSLDYSSCRFSTRFPENLPVRNSYIMNLTGKTNFYLQTTVNLNVIAGFINRLSAMPCS